MPVKFNQYWTVDFDKTEEYNKFIYILKNAFFLKDNNRVLTLCEDNIARIWDIPTKKQIGILMKHDGNIYPNLVKNATNDIPNMKNKKSLPILDFSSFSVILFLGCKYKIKSGFC